MKKLVTTITIALCLLISASAFSQDTLARHTTRGWLYVDSATRLGGVIYVDATIKFDTVDVIALVSDTSEINYTYCWISDENRYNCAKPLTIKCKARYSHLYGITECLLPKKYIVWQTIILNKK